MHNESIPEKESFKGESVESRKYINENSEELPSIIAIFLDHLNLKGLIKSIFQKTPIQITDTIIDAFLLFIFLFYLFISLDALKFEISLYTSLLVVIGTGAALDLGMINIPYVLKYFPSDVRTKYFFDRVPAMTKKEIKERLQNLYISSKCMDLFLESLQEKHNKYPSYFIDLIVDTQVFSKENLNVLSSPTIIKYIRPELIIRICTEYVDSLTYENIQNIYAQYGKNKNVIRILFATQNDSYFLTQNFDETKEDKNKLNEFYVNYQKDKIHLDKILKNIHIPNVHKFRHKLLSYLSISFLVISITSLIFGLFPPPIALEDIAVAIIAPFIFAFLIIVLIVDPILVKIKNYYNTRLIDNVIKS